MLPTLAASQHDMQDKQQRLILTLLKCCSPGLAGATTSKQNYSRKNCPTVPPIKRPFHALQQAAEHRMVVLWQKGASHTNTRSSEPGSQRPEHEHGGRAMHSSHTSLQSCATLICAAHDKGVDSCHKSLKLHNCTRLRGRWCGQLHK